MTNFIVIAALMALLAVAAVAWPLLRRTTGQRRDAIAAVAVLLLVGGGAAGLYAMWSHWSWQSAATAGGSPQSMVSSLARRLESEPDDLPGWILLGRSYAVLEQYPLAARAYQRADRLAGGRSAEALEGWAEALTLNNEDELVGRAGRLFEQALQLNPDSGKSLFFAGIAAQRRGELPLARQRFASLLAHNPPENVRPMIEQQIAMLDVAMKSATAGQVGNAAASRPDGTATGTANARVSVRISVAPALLARLRPDAPLFVLARSPGQPGPPLAVKRLPAQFPLAVELTSADSMLPGRSLTAGQTVEVVARVALGGNPVGSPGDLVGLLRYQVGKDADRELIIDKVTP